MKKVLILFALLLMVSCNSNSDKSSKAKNDLVFEGIKGKVKSTLDKDFKGRNNGTVFGDKEGSILTEYNEDGYKSRVVKYNADGIISQTDEYKYEDGNLIEQTTVEDGKTSKFVWTYNGKDKNTEMCYHDNVLYYEAKYYINNHREDSVVTKFTNGGMTVISYDYLDDNGSFQRHWRNGDGGKMVTTIMCDSNGKEISNYTKTGEYIIETSTKYNKEGWRIERSSDGEIIRYEYPQMDEKGNWTKRLEIFEDILSPITTITIREIEYYE